LGAMSVGRKNAGGTPALPNKKEAKMESLPPGVVGWYLEAPDGLQPALPGRLAASLA
jgi:hypothetical protein